MPRLPHRELTPREKIFCRQHYRGTQHCVARISDKLQASRQTVRQALIEMALITEPCTGPRRWAPDEEVRMVELLVDHSIPEVAEFLGRTEGAIIARKRIIDARLRTERGYYTVAETARILGMDIDWVIKHTQKRRPPASSRPRLPLCGADPKNSSPRRLSDDSSSCTRGRSLTRHMTCKPSSRSWPREQGASP